MSDQPPPENQTRRPIPWVTPPASMDDGIASLGAAVTDFRSSTEQFRDDLEKNKLLTADRKLEPLFEILLSQIASFSTATTRLNEKGQTLQEFQKELQEEMARVLDFEKRWREEAAHSETKAELEQSEARATALDLENANLKAQITVLQNQVSTSTSLQTVSGQQAELQRSFDQLLARAFPVAAPTTPDQRG